MFPILSSGGWKVRNCNNESKDYFVGRIEHTKFKTTNVIELKYKNILKVHSVLNGMKIQRFLT